MNGEGKNNSIPAKGELQSSNVDLNLKKLLNKIRYTGEPEGFLKDTRSKIESSLEAAKANSEKDLIRFFAFKLPGDSHFLPLFEKELFSQLVKFHNTNDTKDQYVNPMLLMSIDPMFPNLKDGKIRGESLFEHELQHFFKWQESRGKSKDSGCFVGFSLVKKLEDGIMLLTYEVSFIPEDNISSFDQELGIAFAPRFPSSGDIRIGFDQAEKEFKKGFWGGIRGSKMLNKVRQKLNQKSVEQGIKKPPLQSREMKEKLFLKWKEKRGEKIKFPQWYKPTSIKYEHSFINLS